MFSVLAGGRSKFKRVDGLFVFPKQELLFCVIFAQIVLGKLSLYILF